MSAGDLLLQSAESLRSRAEEAISCIQYMQNFAACTDFAELPELFQDSSRLSQAAVGHCTIHHAKTYLHSERFIWRKC